MSVYSLHTVEKKKPILIVLCQWCHFCAQLEGIDNISNSTNQWLQRFQCQFIIIQAQVLLLLVGLETQFSVR